MLCPARAWLAALVLSTGGCVTGSSVIEPTTTLTMITADPAAFVGSSACGTNLRRYVVTLAEVTDASFVTLPSSPPTPCTQLVSFGGELPGTNFIFVGHFYVGHIDGYDRDDISPLSLGTPEMVDSTGAVVPPRWSTNCGQWQIDAGLGTGDEAAAVGAVPTSLLAPVQAKESTEVFLLGCTPFTDPTVTGSESSEPDGGPGATDDASQDEAETGSISSD